MKKVILAKSEGETYYIKGRSIPKGCKYCLKGSKVVLFLNGICQKPYHCSWYCPISEERRGKNLTFADEIEIKTKEELLQEVSAIKAQGMSITGGEPLSEANFEKNPLLAVVLGFNVSSGTKETGDVKVLTNDVIYKLTEDYGKWVEGKKKSIEASELYQLVRPCKIQILKGYVFRQSNPAIVGVDVLAGTLKTNIPLFHI